MFVSSTFVFVSLPFCQKSVRTVRKTASQPRLKPSARPAEENPRCNVLNNATRSWNTWNRPYKDKRYANFKPQRDWSVMDCRGKRFSDDKESKQSACDFQQCPVLSRPWRYKYICVWKKGKRGKCSVFTEQLEGQITCGRSTVSTTSRQSVIVGINKSQRRCTAGVSWTVLSHCWGQDGRKEWV